MKTRLILLFVVVILSIQSNGQSIKADPSLSFGLEVGIPVSQNFTEYSKAGFGGSGKIALAFNNKTAATFSAGYITFSGKTFSGTSYPAYILIPLKLGLRYKFAGDLYAEPQLGVTSAKEKGYPTENSLTVAGNLGYMIKNIIDLSARYEAMTKGGITSYVGLRAAFILPL